MIHMLSRFDLKPGTTVKAFRASYRMFIEQMKARALVETSGEIGQRLADTPMDTDDDEAQEYYAVMSFRDRQQMDEAYDYIAKVGAQNAGAHAHIYSTVLNSVFTCWQDSD